MAKNIKIKDILSKEEYNFLENNIQKFNLNKGVQMSKIMSAVNYGVDILNNYQGHRTPIAFIYDYIEKYKYINDNLFYFLQNSSNEINYLVSIIMKICNYKSKEQRKIEKYHFNDYYEKYLEGIKKIDYESYLYTKHWNHFRKEVLKFYGNKCQLCGKEDSVLHVHHNNYENRGRETFNDVTVLCESCHKKFHKGDESER